MEGGEQQNSPQSLSSSGQRKGLLVFIGVLAIATLLSTKYNAWQLRSQVLIGVAPRRYERYTSGDKESKLRVHRKGESIVRKDKIDESSIDHDDDDKIEEEYDDDGLYEMEESFNAQDADNDNELDMDTLSSLPTEKLPSLRNITDNLRAAASLPSPACHPHFNLALPNNRWSKTTKFKRIYFYHARKAGGSSMHRFLGQVSTHYGIELKAVEWSAMEEPGTYDDAATFYVTHLREPVDR